MAKFHDRTGAAVAVFSLAGALAAAFVTPAASLPLSAGVSQPPALSLLFVADVPAAGPFYSASPPPRYIRRPETKEFESFDAGNTAGLVGGAIGAGIANQRGFEYYRQSFFFYGHQPYYGSPYYGGPAYYGGLYSPYYYKK